jgi:hypothetical protein
MVLMTEAVRRDFVRAIPVVVSERLAWLSYDDWVHPTCHRQQDDAH